MLMPSLYEKRPLPSSGTVIGWYGSSSSLQKICHIPVEALTAEQYFLVLAVQQRVPQKQGFVHIQHTLHPDIGHSEQVSKEDECRVALLNF